MCVCVCVCVCVRACVRACACVRADGRAGRRACVCMYWSNMELSDTKEKANESPTQLMYLHDNCHVQG